MAGFTTADIASANAANALQENKDLRERVAALETRLAVLEDKFTGLDRIVGDLIADDTDAADKDWED
jgi:cell division septum initiation protein DivIVA